MNCENCEKISKIIETLRSTDLDDYECCVAIAKIVGIYCEREYVEDVSAVEMCKSELDHDWVCVSIGTDGCTYVCKKCNAHERHIA